MGQFHLIGVESVSWTCPDCGLERNSEPHWTGRCFGCHVKGLGGFNFVGGGSYGRSHFNKATIGEVIRDAQYNADIQGREIAPKTTTYSGPVKV